MSTKFFTNREDNTLFSKFEGVFQHNTQLRYFDILVGYFRASGYFKVRPLLESMEQIRILIGINIDELTVQMQQQGVLFYEASSSEIEKKYQEDFLKDVSESKYDKKTEEGILQFIEDVRNNKIILKAHPSKNIHAKVYILRPETFNEHSSGSVITGSSNLTEAGLGTKNANYEFNVLLNDYPDVKFATDEFELLWQEGVEISSEFIEQTRKKSHLQDITPYELYIKTLIEYFGEEIEFDPNSIGDLPKGFRRLDYQMDAVNQAYQMLKKHNGCFLADVVGLGKTLIAVLIARQFYYNNDFPNYRSKILLVLPPALQDNWNEILEKFHLSDCFDIITTGSLHKVKNYKKYDMIVVDEAHRFRNKTSQSYEHLESICKTPTTKGIAKKILLLSATPLNNRAADLENQLMLFQDGARSSLGFSLSAFFTKIKTRQDILKNTQPADYQQQITQIYEEIREKVLEPLMVRRTRTDLMENDRYRSDLDEQEIEFPHVNKPAPIYYQLPPDLERLFDNTLEKIANKKGKSTGLRYIRYQVISYLKDEKRQELYPNAESISTRLVGLMKSMLLKRMDSSFIAFFSTLENFLKSSQKMIEMIESGVILHRSKERMEDFLGKENAEELVDDTQNNKPSKQPAIKLLLSDFKPEFMEHIKQDHEILVDLVTEWRKVTRKVVDDPKIQVFIEKLPQFLAKKMNPEEKVVIFTESKDTMQHLLKNLSLKKFGILGIDSENIGRNRQKIKANFDANVAIDEQKNDARILITTDVLSEGINLHRANTVINYDTPWNATKLMQRCGRVNRIGTKAKHIYIYNFHPTTQVDDEINLKQKAQVKMWAFHSALGEDSQVYSDDEQVNTYGIFDENIQAEKSATLPYLEEIRKLRQEDSELYNRLKALPAKIRNAKKMKEIANSTLVFMRTADKNTSNFLLVKDQHDIETLTFIQAIKWLQADKTIQSKSLPGRHYRDVQNAIEQFDAHINTKIVEQKTVTNLSKSDLQAINVLKALSDGLPEHQSIQLSAAISTIKQKRYAAFSKKILNYPQHPDSLSAILQVVEQHPMLDEIIVSQNSEPSKTLIPSIIISQSYV